MTDETRSSTNATSATIDAPRDFIRDIVDEDLRQGKNGGRVHTRFPPEPNGYLHIGHAKSICLNFGLAQEYGGKCNLRFDDTNPTKEEQEYVDSIKDDVRWLGADWEDRDLLRLGLSSSSCTTGPIELIKDGKAYVCDLTADEIRQHRGTLTSRAAKARTATARVEENLDLFRAHAGKASSPTARARCGPRSTWPRRTSTCATR